MPSRFAITVLFASISSIHISYAQQVTSDVVVSGASLNDGYIGWATCGAHGQVYRRPGSGRLTSVMRVARDGSTLTFALPEGFWPDAVAPDGAGLNILSSHNSREEGHTSQMYRFDSQADLLTQHRFFIDFHPTKMAVTSSGNTIVLGHSDDESQDDWKYGGAVLGYDDHVIKRFELPLPPGGGGWTFVGPQMAVGDGVAYAILHSDAGSKTAVATISETGHIDIRVVPVPPDTDERHHNEWLFGPGVAVEVYHYVGEKPHVIFRFDEYDLASGEKVATKSSPPAGFSFGCDFGNEVSMLAHSAHVDPAQSASVRFAWSLSSPAFRTTTSRRSIVPALRFTLPRTDCHKYCDQPKKEP
jgi:hypothetical protein